MIRYRSKTVATWAAVLGGAFGLDRFYLAGLGDRFGWLLALLSSIGLFGLYRMDQFGQDDRLAWLLLPWLGLSISAGMLGAIVHGLTADETWDARRNPGQPGRSTRWGPVLGVVTALLIGAAVLMSTIAFSLHKFFEWELQAAVQTRNSSPT